jgi:hypothetical protein
VSLVGTSRDTEGQGSSSELDVVRTFDMVVGRWVAPPSPLEEQRRYMDALVPRGDDGCARNDETECGAPAGGR